MDADFILTKLLLEELRKMGYTEVWLGDVPNPHWMHGCSHGVVSSPKRMDFCGWPSLWSVSQIFGQNSCGNGLANADQTFRSGVRGMISGYYALNEAGEWESAGMV
jgi:hypothetical protein